ncbi:hypothetical protein BDZ91DRAFT_166125 [Kalaharituber pfeilii]|nr:hypothetical protein BDZ91DRAFT_166125 [Kalaharituber pfeilii]
MPFGGDMRSCRMCDSSVCCPAPLPENAICTLLFASWENGSCPYLDASTQFFRRKAG